MKNGCEDMERFSFEILKPFCSSSEQGLKEILKSDQLNITNQQSMVTKV